MSVTEGERQRELQAAIALREREIQELEEMKNSLRSQMVVATPALRSDPLLSSFPVLDYCGKKPRKPIHTIPLEHVGNIMTQFNIAEKAIVHQNNQDKVEINALQRRIREEEKKFAVWAEKKEKMAAESGIDPKFVSTKGRNQSRRLQNYESEATIEELNASQLIVSREIKAGKILREKKGNAISEMTRIIDGRRALIDEIDELYNQIRVVDRDTAVEMEEIERLQKDEEEVKTALLMKRDVADSPSRLLIEQDVTDLKTEKVETVNEHRVPQERVVKAQDYRLSQLDKRLKAVEKALRNSGLSQGVKRILSSSWKAEESALDVGHTKEELYDIDSILPAQEKVHPGIYNLFLSEKERLARVVSILNIVTKEKEDVIAALNCKLDALSRECNLAIQQLDELASGAAFAEETERFQALELVQQQRAYYKELLATRQMLRSANKKR